MRFWIFLFVCFLIFSSFSLVNSESPPPEFELKDGYIIVRGIGQVPENTSPTQGLELARLAAKLDAQRNLLQTIAHFELNKQVSMTSKRQGKLIKIQLDGILKKAEIVPGSEYYDQNTFHLKMRLVEAEFNQTNLSTDNTPITTPTGLIIDASKIPTLPKTILEIRDMEGNLIFSAARALFRDNSIAQASKTVVMKNPLLGENPLIISAVGIRDATLLVTVSDGQLILNSLENSDVFLFSKIAVIIGGSKL